MFPGPLINATTNDIIHVNVFNGYIEPVLFTWYMVLYVFNVFVLDLEMVLELNLQNYGFVMHRNGIQQRQNSWQDGVSGTNCPIQPQTNWTYVFETKDQIGTFFYFPSINFLKAGGGFGPIRVNNRAVISVPFPKPEAEFDLLIGDWYNRSYMVV